MPHPKVAVEWVTLLLRIREVLVSNLGPRLAILTIKCVSWPEFIQMPSAVGRLNAFAVGSLNNFKHCIKNTVYNKFFMIKEWN
jgi:hypothetical protein